jgi:hypothetical protein
MRSVPLERIVFVVMRICPQLASLAGVVAVIACAAWLAAPSGSAGSQHAAETAAVQGFLVIEDSSVATIISRSGKRLPTPARVGDAPLGLSPDARRVAETTGDAVVFGTVAGASMHTVLTGSCPSCPYGADPSFAWSPNSRQLAAAANLPRPPTALKLIDRSGRLVLSFRLPGSNPERGGRAYYHLLSWSPDGSRLLLIRRDAYIDTALVALDRRTGRLRTLATIQDPHDSPAGDVAWSPNGRLVALTSEGRSSNDYIFAVIDAATGGPILQCKPRNSCDYGGTVWAPDSKSLFAVAGGGQSPTGQWSGRIDRVYLSGRRTTVIRSSSRMLLPRVALATGLVYEEYAETPDYALAHDDLYLVDFASGHRQRLMSSRMGIRNVLPLTAIP